MGNDKSKEDIFREVKYGIEHLEWEIENKQKDIEWLEWEIGRKQQELKEKKEWLAQALGKIQGNGDER